MRQAITLLCFCLTLPLMAQNSKKVRDLKSQKTRLERTLKKSQQDLTKTKTAVKKGQQTIKVLDQEIEMRVQFIHRTEHELDSLERKADTLQSNIRHLDSVLVEKKRRYTQSLRMAQTYRRINSSLLFALSAKDVTQMYRRLRYTREYASYQRSLGEQVQQKQIELLDQQNQLLAVKSTVNQKMRSLIAERATLSRQQAQEQKNVAGLQQKEKGLQKQIQEHTRKIAELQKTIDQVVAYEIEQARKRAEAAARRKAEEERRRAEARRKEAAKAGKPLPKEEPKTAASSSSSKASGSSWLTAEERKLNGGFEQNRGRLPVPITGPYMIGVRYGANASGRSGVMLENKGTNYVGQAGARARAVFDGEVSAVFSLSGMKNVLVRHGSYISVYCNLSSVIVAKGQKVKARDLLGTVGDDGSGRYVLHFQLRKETSRLNPEQWIGR